jgi:hypothetical protein
VGRYGDTRDVNEIVGEACSRNYVHRLRAGWLGVIGAWPRRAHGAYIAPVWLLIYLGTYQISLFP